MKKATLLLRGDRNWKRNGTPTGRGSWCMGQAGVRERCWSPTPKLIDELVRKIPKGRLATVNQLRKIPPRFDADITCPATTGIFLNISANTSEEDLASGKKRVTAYWRVLKEGGKLNPKISGRLLPCNPAICVRKGFVVIPAGGKDTWVVKDFERNFVTYGKA